MSSNPNTFLPRAFPDTSALLPEHIAEARPHFMGEWQEPGAEIAYLRGYVDGSRLGHIAATSLLARGQQKEMTELEQRLLTDPLTGLPNNLGLAHAYEQLQHTPDAPPSALAFIDIDHFKDLNTRFGHDRVDRLLAVTAQLMAGALRDTDVLGRRSGDEFIALLQGTSLEQAEAAMQRVAGTVGAIRRHRDIDLDAAQSPITLSIGVVPFDKDTPYEDATEAANTLMRDAKLGGRDSVIVAPPHSSERAAS